MTKFFKRGLFTVFACLLLSGCFGRVQPLYNVVSKPIPAASQALSMKEIGNVIELAAMGRDWLINKKQEGVYELTQTKKTHVAVVQVNYDQKTFSIKYKDSSDLLYNGTNIHRNYNRWVQYLERDIQMGLQQAAMNR